MRVSRLACVLVLAAASHAWAQDAVEWFGKAVYTTNADEQVYFYKKALEADPHYHQAAHNLAGVYYRKGQVRKSIALYEQIIRNAKAYHQTYYNLACCYARVGDSDHALKALVRSFQKGFHDKKLLDRDEDLASLRATPAYAHAVAKYLGGGPVPAEPAEMPAGMRVAAAKPAKKTHPLAKTKKARKVKAPHPAAGALEPVAAGVVVKK